MTQIIIYPNALGKVVIVAPAPDADITDVAAAVVPADTPHRIIDADDLPPASEWLWSDEGPIVAAPDGWAPVPSPPTAVHVNAERDRRILQGSTFALTSGKQIALRGDDTTTKNLQALAFAASLRIQQGAGNSSTLFRDDADYVYELTQAEVLELWTKAAAFVSAMFQAAWFLKDGPSIPQDYTDNKYWSVG